MTRKEKTEVFLRKKGIPINVHLPNIESEDAVKLRKPKEIAQRVTVLSVTSMVAFNSMSGEEAILYLKDHNLWQFTTPKERSFLDNPTDKLKKHETWKCEAIWTLLWAIKQFKELGFPDGMCDLNEVSAKNYPLGYKDPNDFINKIAEIRSETEILDANDLYYRIYWACVDARIANKQMNKVISGVVYERFYALNWLVNYMNQDWDDISCDT